MVVFEVLSPILAHRKTVLRHHQVELHVPRHRKTVLSHRQCDLHPRLLQLGVHHSQPAHRYLRSRAMCGSRASHAVLCELWLAAGWVRAMQSF